MKQEFQEIFDCQVGCQFQFGEANELLDMDGAPCDKTQCRIALNNPTLIHGYDEAIKYLKWASKELGVEYK